MTRWEYLVLRPISSNQHPISDKAQIDILNDLGRQGWELITISREDQAFFKRPVEEAPDAVDMRCVDQQEGGER